VSRDTLRGNIGSYLGDQARRDWGAGNGLFPAETVIIERHFPRAPARILDLGCGGGRTTLALEARGYDVEAIDLSEDLVDEARRHVRRAHVQLMDARTLAFPDAAFDVVLFSFNGLDCVHPSRERKRVLDEVHRVLRPGGLFYYSGHNGLGAWYPRRGDSLGKFYRRNREMLLAQRAAFEEHGSYLAYPDVGGAQILYSALPHHHLRELREHGFAPSAVYGSRSYRTGPDLLDNAIEDSREWVTLVRLARLSVLCPHLHYLAHKPA